MRTPTHRPWCTSLLALALSFGALEALAEVSVRTDRHGNYMMTQVVPTGPDWSPNIWTTRSRGERRINALNPQGDKNGDLWPEVAESSIGDHHPWVVWSKNDGETYDLAWSRWTAEGWAPVEWVESATGWDDLGPDIRFDDRGRPFLVWYRDEGGQAKVYFSMFLSSRWMPAILVSDPTVDARNPQIVRILDSGRINISYETPEGTFFHHIDFDEPVTITDDINPQLHFTVNVIPFYVRPH